MQKFDSYVSRVPGHVKERYPTAGETKQTYEKKRPNVKLGDGGSQQRANPPTCASCDAREQRSLPRAERVFHRVPKQEVSRRTGGRRHPQGGLTVLIQTRRDGRRGTTDLRRETRRTSRRRSSKSRGGNPQRVAGLKRALLATETQCGEASLARERQGRIDRTEREVARRYASGQVIVTSGTRPPRALRSPGCRSAGRSRPGDPGPGSRAPARCGGRRRSAAWPPGAIAAGSASWRAGPAPRRRPA
ncbi:DUF1090 domain-containing protein [Roseateles sp. DAIF2]|nr:DUF1090 domain-containing protein [Roseateles sp. DAIF2]